MRSARLLPGRGIALPSGACRRREIFGENQGKNVAAPRCRPPNAQNEGIPRNRPPMLRTSATYMRATSSSPRFGGPRDWGGGPPRHSRRLHTASGGGESRIVEWKSCIHIIAEGSGRSVVLRGASGSTSIFARTRYAGARGPPTHTIGSGVRGDSRKVWVQSD